jgi:hypothetical protein
MQRLNKYRVDEGGITLRVDKGGIRFRVCFVWVCVLFGFILHQCYYVAAEHVQG